MCLLIAAASAAAGAAELSGRVSDADGRPLAGVMISVIEEGGAKTTTRYTGRDGGYAIEDLPAAEVAVRARNSDTMIRMDPDTGAFDVYPFPTQVTFCREIDFDDRGNVWTSYSNYPTQAIEGGVPVIVRIDPPSQ